MKARVPASTRVWFAWFELTSKALTRFVEDAERSGDPDTAKELLRIKRFFNHCFYKKAIGI